jgi:hypothetical protein
LGFAGGAARAAGGERRRSARAAISGVAAFPWQHNLGPRRHGLSQKSSGKPMRFANNIPRGTSMRSRTASCSCGQLRIEVQGEPLGVGVCHCLACQRRTGSVFAALAAFAAPYKIFGTATEYVRVGDREARFRFRFCPVCGTTVFHTEEGHDESSVGVAVGAFADPGFPPPQDSVYDCRRHSWVQLPPGTKTYDKDPP